MVCPMDERNDTREQILNAAMDRILHYGYGKTTMAEIARDCNMSAGNIYRFFKSKLDIAEAMARTANAETFQVYAELTRRENESAIERLHEFFMLRLIRTHDLLSKDAKVLEVAEVLADERPSFANEELAQERIYLVQLLEQGMSTGEIRKLDDPMVTAEMIQVAFMKFSYPQMWSHLSLESLKREVDGVFDLLRMALSG